MNAITDRNKPIDLRSDTVTRPTQAMRAAMMSADVGDDVWGDDPTVIRLQSIVAERAGFEAGLFLPSGTQSNLAALMAHCERGEEYIVGQAAHTYKYEGGGAAVLGSIQPQPIENEADGSIPTAKIAAAIKPIDDHFPRTKLLALENTIGGKVLSREYETVAQTFARSRGLKVHLDGARICNAAVARGVSLKDACAGYDSVSICFSKGLGAPVGSVLVGTSELIRSARRWRKMLGGGLRQSGILAAGCLHALDHHWNRLAEDHANAEALAAGLREIDGIASVSQATNMIFIAWNEQKLPAAQYPALQAHLFAGGILAAVGPTTRLLTHLDVSTDDVKTVVRELQDFFAGKIRVGDGSFFKASGYAAMPNAGTK